MLITDITDEIIISLEMTFSITEFQDIFKGLGKTSHTGCLQAGMSAGESRAIEKLYLQLEPIGRKYLP